MLHSLAFQPSPTYNSYDSNNGSGVLNVDGFGRVTYTGIEKFNITGTKNGDDIRGGNSDDTLSGGAGNDSLNGGAGVDIFDGGTGNDFVTIDLSASTTNNVVDIIASTTNYGTQLTSIEGLIATGGSGNDTLVGGGLSDAINGGAGDDVINAGTSGLDTGTGGTGTDTLIVDYSGNTNFNGITYNSYDSTNGNGVFNVDGFGRVTYTGIEKFNITGTKNGDDIRGGNSDDTLSGGAGNDSLNGGAGVDIFDGGTGNDFVTIDLSASTTNNVVDIIASTTNYGTQLTSIEGLIATGGSGNDTLVGGGLSDAINGGAGDDVINAGTSGLDTGTGGTGTDTLIVDYSGNTNFNGITYNSYDSTNGNGVFNVDGFGRVTYTSIEKFNITGTKNGDDIRGGNSDDTLSGGAGNDTLTAGAGNDTINAGLGIDNVDGGAGDDLLILDYSSNTYAGGNPPAGIFSSIGSNGAGGFNGSYFAYTDTAFNVDQVSFSNIERFQITGTGANDNIQTGDGNDNINAGAGNDTVNAGLGVNIIDGGTGIDTLINADFSTATTNLSFNETGTTAFDIANVGTLSNVERFQNLKTGSGDDVIGFTERFNNGTIQTGAGNDTINAGLGQDNVDGDAGDDLLILDYSSNTYAGGNPPAGIFSSIGSNGAGGFNGSYYAYTDNTFNFDQVNFSNIERFQITGTGANDNIQTGDGNDTINSGDGNDTVNAGLGVNIIDGGAGIDTLVNADFSTVTTALNVNDTGTQVNVSLPNGTSISNFEVFTNLATGSGNDVISYTNRSNNSVNTGAGNDTINAGLGQDNVDGGAGDDLLILDYSSNTYADGNPPAGIFSSIGSNGAGGFNGSYFAYTDNTFNFDQVSFSNIERFQITGTGANDNIQTGDGNDTINAGAGNDIVNAGGGNDRLVGVAQNAINPGLGEIDILNGGAAGDIYVLGNAATTFYDDGNTTTAGTSDYARIVGFNVSEDFIQLTGPKSSYVLGSSPIVGIAGTAIYINKPGSEPDELIGIIEDLIGLDLNASYFIEAQNDSGLFSFSQPTFSIPESSNATITITREQGTVGAVSVLLSLSDGTATAPNDYDSAPITVTFADGEISKTVTIPIVNDSDVESTETINLALSTPTGGATLGTQTTAVLSIIDNDTATNVPIVGTRNSDTLTGGIGNDLIYGKGGDDILTDNDGNDLLDGGKGSDTLTGGIGDDTYIVNTLTDIIIENSNEGIDTVQSSVKWTLGDNLENLTLTGTKSISGTGNTLDNVLTGNTGKNTLDGGEGNDTLSGGIGNDTYIVDNTSDSTTELSGEGIDTVKSSVDWTLGAELENLTLTGTSTLSGTGNALDNVIIANSFGNVLSGGDGNDTLKGGIGNDSLFGGNGNDNLVSGLGDNQLTGGMGDDILSLGGGTDTVFYSSGDGSDLVKQFAHKIGGDLLSFQGIPNIDVIKLGKNTEFRISDGISGNAGFGSGDLLMTLQGTTGFTVANIGQSLDITNTAEFQFS